MSSSSAARVYLYVPFEEKDEAKSAGARWEADKKKWFIPEDFKGDRSVFKKWEEPPTVRPSGGKRERQFFKEAYKDLPPGAQKVITELEVSNASLKRTVSELKLELQKLELSLEARTEVICLLQDELAVLDFNVDSLSETFRMNGLCEDCHEYIDNCECDKEVSEIESESDSGEEEPAVKKAKV